MSDYVEVEVVSGLRICCPLGNPGTQWLITIKQPPVIKVLPNPEQI